MIRQPRGDTTTWDGVLSHRADEARTAAIERFEACGVAPDQVEAVLEDGGDTLHAAATAGAEGWAEDFGGPLPTALLAAEVSALAAHLNSRASSVRALAVNNLLDDYSAVTVAARLGVSRQKVYEIGKGAGGAFIDLVPLEETMTPITELVDLPDPKERPLVHPLDLPEAGRLYRISWLIGTLTNASIALCISAILWYVGRDYIGPVFAFVAIVAAGTLASSGYEHRAWQFIPRKRQDRKRPLPIVLELGSALILAAVLAVALVLITLRLSEGDIIPGVRDFIFGMGVAACLIALILLVVRLARRVWWRMALMSVPALLALVGCTSAADAILFAGAGPASAEVAIYGGISMLVIGAVWAIWTLVDRRRQRAAAAPNATC